jgi:hypothetical protein
MGLMLRRSVLGVLGVSVVCLLVGGLVLSASALAAAPEEPLTVSPAGAVTATSATLEGVLNPGAAGAAGEYEFLYAAGSECTGGSAAPEPAGIALGLKGEAESVAVSGLLPGTQYTFCLFERNAAEETAIGQPVSFTTPAVAPVVSEEFALDVTSDSATLGATIDPGGSATSYRFEYGTTVAYGQSTPESASVGEDDTGHAVSAHIQGLQAGTVYHYRVVASSAVVAGGVAGPDHVITTQSAGGSFELPDGRAYELVTPVDKGDDAIPPSDDTHVDVMQASVSGDALAYWTYGALPGSQEGEIGGYLASRGGGGWSSQSLIPPQATNTVLLEQPTIPGYSADLSKMALEDGGSAYDSPPLVSGEPANNHNLFLRYDESGSFQLMDVTPPGVTPEAAAFEGASPDFSHIVFADGAKLTPEALDEVNDVNIYQWAGGVVSLVSQIPTPPAIRCGAGEAPCSAAPKAHLGAGRSSTGAELNAVSADGSKVFFQNEVGSIEEGQFELYVRESGFTTVEVSASQKTNGSGPGGTDPKGPLTPTYKLASADGSKVFFTSCEQLTNDSTAVKLSSAVTPSFCHYEGEDLYQYDLASGVLTDLTVDHTPGDSSGANVQGVLGASVDGSYVYFVATGVLAGGATPGGDNLYVSHGGTTTFIATLESGDKSDWLPITLADSNSQAFTSRVTPDGLHLAFDSTLSLTGYDNTVVSGGHCGTNRYGEPLGAQCSEIFLYDAASNVLSCVSCNPTGARPLGSSSLDPVEGQLGSGVEYLPRNLSEDGSRVFFDSSDALVPGDTNSRQDVYEWEGGRVYLISSGTSGEDSAFVDASASGDDVFFSTTSQLVGQDIDETRDIYDARVGGGFPFTPPSASSCVGEGCRPAPSVAPVVGVPGSVGFSGVGNLVPAPAPGPVVGVKRSTPRTRAQKLAAALRVCGRESRRRRPSCVARARRLYGPAKTAGVSSRRFGRGTK